VHAKQEPGEPSVVLHDFPCGHSPPVFPHVVPQLSVPQVAVPQLGFGVQMGSLPPFPESMAVSSLGFCVEADPPSLACASLL
jgi:hypothetical protein